MDEKRLGAAVVKREWPQRVVDAFEVYVKADAQADGALAVVLALKQPALATAREIFLAKAQAAAEAFVAFERARLASGDAESDMEAMNRAYWTMAVARTRLAAS